MDCLKRAIKIADICMNQAKNLYLFITLLNKYLYFFSLGLEVVLYFLIINYFDI